jgi:RimJ/RimL family protein N-acetyltransferase
LFTELAEKCGFKAEGRIGETLYLNGKFHDGLEMGVLRQEFERTRPKPKWLHRTFSEN